MPPGDAPRSASVRSSGWLHREHSAAVAAAPGSAAKAEADAPPRHAEPAGVAGTATGSLDSLPEVSLSTAASALLGAIAARPPPLGGRLLRAVRGRGPHG